MWDNQTAEHIKTQRTVSDTVDATVQNEPSGSFFQSRAWAEVKQAHGWQSFVVSVPDGFGLMKQVRVLCRKVPVFGSIAYVPDAVLESMEHYTASTVQDMSDAFASFVRKELRTQLPSHTMFLRWDMPWIHCAEKEKIQAPKHTCKGMYIQPECTTAIDLSLSNEELRAKMKPKTRYNISLATRKGVVITQELTENEEQIHLAVRKWYALYKETAQRDNIAIHTQEYYETVVRTVHTHGHDIGIYTATYEGNLLASIIVVMYGAYAIYLYGASSDQHRNLMPSYLLHWQLIQYARERGCRWYDFFGIPSSAQQNNSMHGLYRFKTGFGGAVFSRPLCMDIPLSLSYTGYRAIERMRMWYYRKWKKRRS